ncbi:MAG: cytochrome-c peroxidase [Prochloraceae cyanobacterium]|nr:cytochrome-c peroxidase [Prochloraceae cyanobacterium]
MTEKLKLSKRVASILVVSILILTLSFFSFSKAVIAQEDINLSIFGSPLPENMFSGEKPDRAKIDLGRELYYEKRLSKNADISCNSCHQLDNYGVDNLPTSPGHKGQLGTRNSPSVYNAAAHIAQFWDGRAEDVEQQALGPILNPGEMAMPSEEKVLEVLKSMPEYVAAFQEAFPDESNPLKYENIGKAIGAFERELVTPAPFDKYLAGDTSALTSQQKQGLKVFTETGCIACHNGTYVGGGMYQKVGLVEDWPTQKDRGRYEVTHQDSDRMIFKVPSLRNVAMTAPYFHDGQAKNLARAVEWMGKYQLGKDLSQEETSAIVAFLDSLTGEIPTNYIEEPKLPETTDKTPLPDPN